jgi:hypothetical protein
MVQSFARRSGLSLISGRDFIRQLFQSSKTLLKIVETHITSPTGYLITGSAMFLAGAFSGQLLRGVIKPIFSKILNALRKDNPEMVVEPSQPTMQFMEDGSLYQYLPLIRVNEIRLLELMPRSQEDPAVVNCQLHHYQLQGIPPYICLSYTWGKGAKDSHSICIAGQRFSTSRKVYEMLLDASTWEPLPLLLWVDAICINQDDTEEKTRQVCMMRSIFTWASLVMVWLGDANDSALAVEVMNDACITLCSTMAGLSNEEWLESVKSAPPIDFAGYRPSAMIDGLLAAGVYRSLPGGGESLSHEDLARDFVEHVLPRCRKEVFQKYSDPCNRQKLVALAKLLSNPWWIRVWVIQEVLISTNVRFRYGQEQIPWDLISVTAIVFHDIESSLIMTSASKYNIAQSMKGLRAANIMYGLRTELANGETVSLSKILGLTSIFQATDPRDKVYALLGVTNNILTQALLPDYGKSVEQVYTDVAQHFITNGESFFTMKYAGVGHGRAIEGLPSWVPDWTLIDRCPPFDTGFMEPWEYRASLDAVPEIRLNLGTSAPIIDIKGAEIDVISALGVALFDMTRVEACPLISRETDTVSFQHLIDVNELNLKMTQFFDRADEVMKALGDTYVNGQPLQEAFWRTCLGDQVLTARPAPDEYEEFVRALPKYYSNIVAQFKQIQRDREQDPDVEETPDIAASEFFDKMDSFHDYNVGMVSEWTLDGTSLATVKDLATNGPRSAQFFNAFRPLGRNFCVTSKGYIGLVPPKTEVGDKVCILFGGRTPFLLRDAGGGKHVLVGECYIHGMMDGEALPQACEGTWFSLC